MGLDLTRDDDLEDVIARGEALAEVALEDAPSAERAAAALAGALGLLCRAQGLDPAPYVFLARIVCQTGEDTEGAEAQRS